ncbi:ABC-type transport auxiliary lipoprotein family protein [Massilia yuzhufengensis]|uniref:ABC-type transport auxiliary lipoprotein family protein n=1 Tax=Massilia yuzhufengensis TaxID=1164594 RepID=UPI001E563F76|nr:ABC-type transport auxiliary lipoprotein family protein [Massilia yuzhufengensis]
MTAHPLRSFIALAVSACILAGCASNKAHESTTYDFGPAAATGQQAAATPVAALVVMDATGPAALENERMYYRLNYADALQARTYANSRWASNPLQMVTQRFKTRLAQSGMKVLSATDASTGVPLLRVEVDDFVHAFSGVAQSEGYLTLRASLFNDHKLVDQRTFTRSTPAPSADAPGGARALAGSTDAVAADILAWLATVDTRKR